MTQNGNTETNLWLKDSQLLGDLIWGVGIEVLASVDEYLLKVVLLQHYTSDQGSLDKLKPGTKDGQDFQRGLLTKNFLFNLPKSRSEDGIQLFFLKAQLCGYRARF
jgi:hypothetical protein